MAPGKTRPQWRCRVPCTPTRLHEAKTRRYSWQAQRAARRTGLLTISSSAMTQARGGPRKRRAVFRPHAELAGDPRAVPMLRACSAWTAPYWFRIRAASRNRLGWNRRAAYRIRTGDLRITRSPRLRPGRATCTDSSTCVPQSTQRTVCTRVPVHDPVHDQLILG
jgi:hypothetical protein